MHRVPAGKVATVQGPEQLRNVSCGLLLRCLWAHELRVLSVPVSTSPVSVGFTVVFVVGPQGYYCPEGISDFTIYPCPPGTFGGQDLLQAVSECTRCTAGA